MPLGSGAFGHKVLSRGPHADRQSAVQQRADAPASADWAVDAMQGGGTSLVQQAFMIFLVLLFAAAAVWCVLLGSQRATRTSELVRAVERSAADVIATTLTPRQLFVAWNGMALHAFTCRAIMDRATVLLPTSMLHSARVAPKLRCNHIVCNWSAQQQQ